MKSFSIILVVAATIFTVASGFQANSYNNVQRQQHLSASSSSVRLNGLFDGFINSMEAGYKGEDSAFKKQKAADEKKRLEKKAEFEARRSKGFTELKDVKARTFAKVKYDEPKEAPAAPAAEKKKGPFGLW